MSTEAQPPAGGENAQAPQVAAPSTAPAPAAPPASLSVPPALGAPPPQPAASRGSGLGSFVIGLVGVLLGVVVGAAGVGENILRYLSPEVRQTRELSELSTRLDDLRRDLTAREKELSAERQERKLVVADLKQSLEASEWRTLAANFKADFQSRFLAYERGRTETTRRHLVEAACGLRTQSPSARVNLVMSPLDVSRDELRRGARPEVEQLLLQAGIGQELLARARRDPARITIPAVTPFNVAEVQRAAQTRRLAMRDVQEAIEAIQQRAQKVKVVRAVRFADGEEHVVPAEVSLAMAVRKDCAGE